MSRTIPQRRPEVSHRPSTVQEISSLTKESDLRADNGYAGLPRRTVLRRVEGIAQVRQLTPGPDRRAPRANHARRRLRRAVRSEGGAGIAAAVASRGAITRAVATEVACPTAPISALDEPSGWTGRTARRRGALRRRAGVGGATDLPRHIDCSEAVTAGARAAARNAIRRAVARREPCGKDAHP
jgi:hypothetical protein